MTVPDPQRMENVVIARPTLTARKKFLSGLRSQFESKSQSKNSKNSKDADLAPTSPRTENGNDMELGIRVRVERSVVVDHTPADESDHSSLWDTPEVK
jgi:hypothetical protein